MTIPGINGLARAYLRHAAHAWWGIGQLLWLVALSIPHAIWPGWLPFRARDGAFAFGLDVAPKKIWAAARRAVLEIADRGLHECVPIEMKAAIFVAELAREAGATEGKAE